MSSPFQRRAVVEGFYGVYYTAEERSDLIQFLGQHGFNGYIYAPKNDWYHRDRWREPYPQDIVDQLAGAVERAQGAGVAFCYAISPGLTMIYSSERDFDLLTTKLHRFYILGVRDFALLLDDIPPEFHAPEDRERYPTYGAAHADVTNRLHTWLQALDPACALTMCPTDYHGVAPFDAYLHELGALLDPAVDVFYTGPDICSTTITRAQVAGFAEAVRRPPLLWDNYPVNDGPMAPRMHIGPIRGRDPALAEVVRGIAVNPMNQPEASKIPLATYADYLAAPRDYEPERTWERALRAAGGGAYEPLCRFAENSLSSCLHTPEAAPLEARVTAALGALRAGEPTSHPAVDALEQYLRELNGSSYFLKYRMRNLALRQELLPWIDLLDTWVAVGRSALETLRAVEHGMPHQATHLHMTRAFDAAQRHPKRWGGQALKPLVELVAQRATGELAP